MNKASCIEKNPSLIQTNSTRVKTMSFFRLSFCLYVLIQWIAFVFRFVCFNSFRIYFALPIQRNFAFRFPSFPPLCSLGWLRLALLFLFIEFVAFPFNQFRFHCTYLVPCFLAFRLHCTHLDGFASHAFSIQFVSIALMLCLLFVFITHLGGFASHAFPFSEFRRQCTYLVPCFPCFSIQWISSSLHLLLSSSSSFNELHWMHSLFIPISWIKKERDSKPLNE